ncbi:DNA polymerase I [Gammaproteobacteria bacterium]|nr:DNA polymerase I [Gammaproteobacteria bacterium]
MIKPIVLIDGSSYLYRAFHALPPLTNSKNLPTGAIYGVINMIKKLFTDYNPEYLAIIFDPKGKTLRNKIYEQYKANRSAMPEDLAKQIEPLYKIISAMGIPMFIVNEVEADDVIATIADHADNNKKRVLISTSDKDLAQLVNDNISLVNTMSNTTLTTDKVIEKFGIPPNLIIDYLSLTGDTSDNIPGIPNVGPKTAVKWLKEYGNLDGVILNANNIKGKVGENLRSNLNQLNLAKELVTIKKDISLDFDIKDLKLQQPNNHDLIKIYEDLEFKNWLKLISNEKSKESVNKNYETILTLEQLDKWIKLLKNSKKFAFDTETTNLDYMSAKLVGISLSISENTSCYIPLKHSYENVVKQLDLNLVLNKLKPILENNKIGKIGHNIKYDIEILKNYNININGDINDTMLESFVVDSSISNHGMDSVALKYLNVKTIKYEDVTGKGVKQVTFDNVEINKASDYASEDANITFKLNKLLYPKIAIDPGLKYIYEKIETPLIKVLSRIERTGVLINADMLKSQTNILNKKLTKLEENIFNISGNNFNLNSPKQLQEILFSKLNLPVLQKTPTGQPSTADSVLQELAIEFDLPKYIIEYRSIAKLISTYTNKLPDQINLATKRIHTSYNQSGASTGRLSSSDPNLQNIPIRTPEGRKIRQAFIAPSGFKLISADYSQIELRIMAHISKDKNLVNAFVNNLDVHKSTAAEILGIPLESVTYDQRRKAKAINFGLIYGMSAFGLAKQIGCTRDVAQVYIDKYFSKYPGVRNYMENTKAIASQKGYVETLWGRRLYLSEINAKHGLRRKAAERAAINAPLQGTAADLIKTAMISLDSFLQSNQQNARMIMQVHDELVFEVADDLVTKMIDIIRLHMMNAADLDIPLNVSVGVGDNWDSASAN